MNLWMKLVYWKQNESQDFHTDFIFQPNSNQPKKRKSTKEDSQRGIQHLIERLNPFDWN